MTNNSPANAPKEAQKYIQAKELHDDKKLENEVTKFSKMIASGNRLEYREGFKNYRVEGIGNLESAITSMDLQNRAKDGRVIHTNDEQGEVVPALVKNGSNLAKIIQLYVIAFDASVQKSDFSKSLAGVDGNLERFTMQGLTQVIQAIKNRHAIDAIKRETDQNTRSGPLKGMGVDVETGIRNKGNINEDLRSKREMSVDLLGDNLNIKSYNQESHIDLQTGKIIFGGLLSSREYPLSVHLVRDRDNKQNPLFIESEVNRTNIKNAMKLINLVHFVVSEFMTDEKKSKIRDIEKPFYVSVSGLMIDDSIMLGDTKVAHRKTINNLLADARSNTSQDPEIIARFLNDIFRSKYQQKPIDLGSTHVGNYKPISSQP